ncbi:MAG: hypothetical protein CL799_13715 [Chromatiales bacterium]|jgi:hypothetical protein|nr:hypothetical protein [Chromatiales bacterium]
MHTPKAVQGDQNLGKVVTAEEHPAPNSRVVLLHVGIPVIMFLPGRNDANHSLVLHASNHVHLGRCELQSSLLLGSDGDPFPRQQPVLREGKSKVLLQEMERNDNACFHPNELPESAHPQEDKEKGKSRQCAEEGEVNAMLSQPQQRPGSPAGWREVKYVGFAGSFTFAEQRPPGKEVW